jgi:hypothetical protein
VARNANLFQRPPHRQGGLLDQPDDLKLLGGRVPHVASSPSAVTLFFEQTIFEGQFGHDFLQRAGLATQVLDLVRGGGPGCIASQALLSSLQEVLRPAIVQVLRDPLAATQLGNAVLAAQAFQKPCDKGC